MDEYCPRRHFTSVIYLTLVEFPEDSPRPSRNAVDASGSATGRCEPSVRHCVLDFASHYPDKKTRKRR